MRKITLKSRYRKTKVSRSKIRKAVKGAFSKKIILSVLILILAVSVEAQSPFKKIPLPKADYYITVEPTLFPDSTPTISILKSYPDTSFFAGRFLVNVSSYAIGGPNTSTLLTGFGYGLQKLHLSGTTEQYNVVYSASIMLWYKAPLNGDKSSNAFAYGVSVGLLNNLILAGAAYDGKHAFATLGIGINLN